MEDPNRMRTKLRLDLNDVEMQIRELEELVDKDNKPEHKEQLDKLITYEQNLREQYEKMAGISIDQAQTSSATRRETMNPSRLGRFLGLLTGLFLFGGYYNLTLYSLGKYAVTDFIDYFLNGGDTVSIEQLETNLITSPSFEIILLTLGLPIIFTFVRSVLSNSRAEQYSITESLGHVLPATYILFIIAMPNVAHALERDMIYYSYVILASAFFYFISILGSSSSAKFMGIINTALIAYSGVQAYIIAGKADIGNEIMYGWLFLFAGLMFSGLVSALSYLFGFIKD